MIKSITERIEIGLLDEHIDMIQEGNVYKDLDGSYFFRLHDIIFLDNSDDKFYILSEYHYPKRIKIIYHQLLLDRAKKLML